MKLKQRLAITAGLLFVCSLTYVASAAHGSGTRNCGPNNGCTCNANAKCVDGSTINQSASCDAGQCCFNSWNDGAGGAECTANASCGTCPG